MLKMFDWRLYKKAATTMTARENPVRTRAALARATMTMARENLALARATMTMTRENAARARVALMLVRAMMMMAREIRQGKGSR
jgi:hypothetical protein